MSNKKSTKTMSDGAAKAVAIGGLGLMGLIATSGEGLAIGAIALNPFVWGVVVMAGAMVLITKPEKKDDDQK